MDDLLPLSNQNNVHSILPHIKQNLTNFTWQKYRITKLSSKGEIVKFAFILFLTTFPNA